MVKALKSARQKRSLAGCWGLDVLEPRALLTAIVVHAEPVAHGAVNLTVTELTPDDPLSGVFPAPGGGIELFCNNPDGFTVNGGPAQQLPTFAAINNLTWNLGGGNDGFYLQDVSLNNLKIVESATTTGQSFDAIRSLNAPVNLGNVSFISAQSWDFNMDGFFPTTMQSLSLKATTPVPSYMYCLESGDQISVLGDFNYTDLGATASSFIEADLGFNIPLRLFETVNFHVGGNMNINLGDGGNTVTMGVSVDGNASINMGNGINGVGLFGGGAEFRKSVVINTGADPALIGIDGNDSTPLKIDGSLAILTGPQNDSVSLTDVVVGDALFINAGSSDSSEDTFASNNSIKIGNTVVFGDTWIQSSGDATVAIFANNSQTTEFHGLITILLASGTIDTTLFPIDPTSQVIFDQYQIYAGLKQTVTVKYASNVVYNPHKLLLINAVLA